MPVNIECPSCDKVFTASDSHVSEYDNYTCPFCKADITIEMSFEDVEIDEDEDEIDAGNGGA